MMANGLVISNEALYFLGGSTFIGILGHAVNSFPTPNNPYGQWILGVLKYIVGQRVSALNALNGLQSEVTAVTTSQKTALAAGSTMEVVKSDGVLVPTIIKPLSNGG